LFTILVYGSFFYPAKNASIFPRRFTDISHLLTSYLSYQKQDAGKEDSAHSYFLEHQQGREKAYHMPDRLTFDQISS
jgi:hypothetical protein